ncbi:hypothetical protein [Metabacillus halosaccharovorans]|uniref:hypothetical protein n=1 Tax=Metabacillus halosaccharovorans TaxID=930124 RepID=UPI001C1FF6D4|nr:hypothetical protein [Metabacillus halosaccharovorans]
MHFQGRLNKRSVPFLLLALLQTFLICLLKKRRSSNTWILFFLNIGMAFIFEYIVLNLLQAYTYKPSLVKKRYFDNILGAILSQAIYIPVSATFITVFNKKLNWKLGFTVFFYCIEHLFILLKIYKINWWKPIYTVILLPVYYVLSDFFYKGLEKQKIAVRKLAHYLTIMVIETIFMYVLAYKGLIQFGKRHFYSSRLHFMIAPVYCIFMSFISTSLAEKKGVFFRIVHLCSYKVVDVILVKTGIMTLNRHHIKWRIPWHCFMVFITRNIYQRIFRSDN